MNDEDAIKQFGLPAAQEHRNAIRAVFEAEMVKEADEEGDHELIKCLSIQLFSIGNVEDSMLIWQAKSDSFDLMCGLDVQFLCGAGVDDTREYLRSQDSESAAEALKCLEECIATGDFDGWTPDKWVRYYRFYYHLDSDPPPDL